MRAYSRVCSRGREWISRGLDGELSEFEQALLDAHLARCAGCRSFAADAATVTTQLRAAPLERPQRPIALPRRRAGVFRPIQVGAAAALVATAVGIGSLLLSVGSDTTRPVVSAGFGNSDLTQQKILRRGQLRSSEPLLWLPPRGRPSI